MRKLFTAFIVTVGVLAGTTSPASAAQNVQYNVVKSYTANGRTVTCTYNIMHGRYLGTSYAKIRVATGYSNTYCQGMARVQATNKYNQPVLSAQVTSTNMTWAQANVIGNSFQWAIYRYRVYHPSVGWVSLGSDQRL